MLSQNDQPVSHVTLDAVTQGVACQWEHKTAQNIIRKSRNGHLKTVDSVVGRTGGAWPTAELGCKADRTLGYPRLTEI